MHKPIRPSLKGTKTMSLKKILFTALALLILGACSQSTEPAPATPATPAQTKSEKPQVALIMKSLANEFFKTMEDGARAYHSEHTDDFDFLANGIKNEEDVTGQVALVEQMIAKGVDAIVIAPADSKALVSVLEKAQQAGIIVVNIDNKLDGDVLKERNLRVPFVGPDNRKGAKQAAAYLAGKLAKGDKVAMITGVPSAFNGIQRRLGFIDAMSEAGIEIVAEQSGSWEIAKGNQVAAGIINEHKDIKALLCANDSMALGAVSALRDAGKQDVYVIGFDAISAAEELIKQGAMLCTVNQHADQVAVYGIQYALEMLKNGTAPEDRETPVEVVSAETLK